MIITNILLFLILSFLVIKEVKSSNISKMYNKNEIEDIKHEDNLIMKTYQCFICKRNFMTSESSEVKKEHNICDDKCLKKYKEAGFKNG